MLLPLMLLLAGLSGVADEPESVAMREVPFACSLVQDRASRYFADHGITSKAGNADIRDGSAKEGDLSLFLGAGGPKHLTSPSGARIWLNRFGITKYVKAGQIRPLIIYSNFRMYGRLDLAQLAAAVCRATLHFQFVAYEWSPILIVDGFPVELVSAKVLEREFLEAICDLPK